MSTPFALLPTNDQASPRWDHRLSLEEAVAGVRFYIVWKLRRSGVCAVVGDHLAPDHPTVLCYDSVVLKHDGDGVTYAGDGSTGGTFLERSIADGEAYVTQSWDDALAHLLTFTRHTDSPAT